MTESSGPEYVRPANPPCPDCDCCTAPLCEKGRRSALRGCAGYTDGASITLVRHCPCSAETTPGTAAYLAARHRAAMHALERPLPYEAEALLRALAAGHRHDEGDARQLLVWRYAARLGGRLVITDAGRAYVAAREGAS